METLAVSLAFQKVWYWYMRLYLQPRCIMRYRLQSRHATRRARRWLCSEHMEVTSWITQTKYRWRQPTLTPKQQVNGAEYTLLNCHFLVTT